MKGLRLFYLLARYGSPDTAPVHTLDLLSVLAVAPVDGHVLEQALALPCRDMEDAVQMSAARQAGADYLVTRDRAGHAAGPLPALAPRNCSRCCPPRTTLPLPAELRLTNGRCAGRRLTCAIPPVGDATAPM